MPVVSTQYFGRQEEPLVIIDDFHPAPEALLEAAKAQRFTPSQTFYPGVQAPAPARRRRILALTP